LRFAYLHAPPGGGDPVGMTVRSMDGSVIREIGADVANSCCYEWSPAGDKMLLTRASGGDVVDLATGTVTAIRPNADPYEVLRASWIGTTGDISFISKVAGTEQTGLTVRFSRLAAGATTGARELGTANYFISDAGVSPDGSKLLYFVWGPEVRTQGKLHVIDLTTGADRAVTPEVDVADAQITEWENPVWSPDGSHIAAEVYTAGPNHIGVIPATGGDPVMIGPEFPTGTNGAHIRFSPDGKLILATYNFNGDTWLLPVDGSPGRLLPWADSMDDIAWQRLAP
jgi:Tol biopolymer transport system component